MHGGLYIPGTRYIFCTIAPLTLRLAYSARNIIRNKQFYHVNDVYCERGPAEFVYKDYLY